MTSMEGDGGGGGGGGQILKVDTKGRVRVARERREALLGEYDRSAMSGAAFAQWAGIKYSTLMWWLRERQRSVRPTGAEVVATDELKWVEAVVEENDPGQTESGGSRNPGLLEITLSGGASLRVSSPAGAALAAEVLRQLGMGGRC